MRFLDMSDDPLKSIIYTGSSMNPTLRVGDGLRVIPYGDSRIRVGDVVVFRHPERQHNVVHRVVSVDTQEVRTRGDNNNRVDTWILRPDEIIGRVVFAQRKSRNITIHGGAWGRICVPAHRVIKRVNVTVSRILHPAYHRLAKSGVFRRWLPPQMKTRVVCFKRPSGTEQQLLMGRCVIGRRLSGQDQWQIRRPFRLFVNEASLPGRDLDYSTTPESRVL